MPSYQQITAARLKAKRIREYAAAFREESARMHEATNQPCAPGSLVVIDREASPKTGHVRLVGRVA